MVLVNQIDLYGKLNGHAGCVNTVQFNSTGDFLVSGSDDRQVMFWNWAMKKLEFSYPSGHLDNIFQVRIMPFTDDRKIVTSSADGLPLDMYPPTHPTRHPTLDDYGLEMHFHMIKKVRLGQVLEKSEVETKRLGKHQGRVHNLAVEPGSPYIFYSCGEDGFIQHLFCCYSFTENKQSSSSIRLNAIVIDPRNPNYFAVRGSDQYARVYDTRKYQLDARPVNTFWPRHLIETHDVHITALAYSHSSELLVSYNDELIYLFQKNMGIGISPLLVPHEDLQKLEEPLAYEGHRNSHTIKGVSFFGPHDEYVMSGSDCGRIYIYGRRKEPHSAASIYPVIATCGIGKNIKLWAPSSNDFLPLPPNVQEIMESNRQAREDHSRITVTPDVIMCVLWLHRRQALTYIQSRYNTADVEDDEEDKFITAFSGDVSSEDGNSRECSIS
ncbi:DDB1- and CUL4-associated factor 8 [Camellia lanceoleosa]|uniref:DDB1- and CUL4-associated factor 8 n=1 Tax=Camellia lanceoleosa TaxID=1840588 RepID=A0ACC0HTK1_9ERIC|nr:DDB1- and CUL4-associated factor 8 [Camellia lanceoleosa]